MRKNIVTILVLVLVVALSVAILTACGNDQEKTVSEADAIKIIKDAATASSAKTSYSFTSVSEVEGETYTMTIKYDGKTLYIGTAYGTNRVSMFCFTKDGKYYRAISSTTKDESGETVTNKKYIEIEASDYQQEIAHVSLNDMLGLFHDDSEEEEEKEEGITTSYSTKVNGDTTTLVAKMEQTIDGEKQEENYSFEIKGGLIVKISMSSVYGEETETGTKTVEYDIGTIEIPNEADYQDNAQ